MCHLTVNNLGCAEIHMDNNLSITILLWIMISTNSYELKPLNSSYSRFSTAINKYLYKGGHQDLFLQQNYENLSSLTHKARNAI